MRRINIFLDKNDVERLSVAIARLESLHLRSDNGEEWSEESPKWGGLLDTYLGYKRRIDRLHAILQSPTAPEEAFVEPHPSLHAEQLDDAIGEIESEVLAWKKEADKIDSEIEQVELLRREVSALRPLGVPLEELRNPTHVDWTVGTIPTENLGRLETLLFRVPVVVLSLGRSGDRTLVLIASAVEGSSRSERDGTGEPAVRERLRTHLYQRERLRRVYQSLDLEQPDRTVYAPPEETSGEERVSSSIERIENEISEWQEELQRNRSRIESVERTLVRVRRLEPLDVPFEKLREREHLTWEVGTMPEEAMERFRRSPASLDIVLLPLESEGEERLVAAVSTTQEDGTLRRMMEGVGLAPLELPDEIERVPADVADSLQRQVEEARSQSEQLTARGEELRARWNDTLDRLWEAVDSRASVAAVRSATRGQTDIDSAIRGLFFEPLNLPTDVSGRPREIVAALDRRLEESRRHRREIRRQRSALRDRWRHRLGGLTRTVGSNVEVVRAITGFDRHNGTYLIAGWTPEDRVDELLMAIEGVTAGRADAALAAAEAPGAPRTPTLLRNPRFLRPFQTLVSTFGYPAYREADPTLLAGLTFVLMYGMMFGDVGHGLIVAILGVIAAVRLSGMGAAVGSLLAVSGLSGTLFGFLYGSFFGREDLLPALWLTPLKGVLSLLAVSVAGGVVLLNAGFLINIGVRLRNRNWSSLLLDSSGIAGLVLYWGMLGGGYGLYVGAIPGWLFALLVVIPALALMVREPVRRIASGDAEEVGGALFVEGFFELFETILSFISNTLSFVRLGAFGVAHAALMTVVFRLGTSAGGVARWVIIIIGTLFVVGLEGLIVGLQALRLEYYEFFSKFFSGTGRLFRPFTLTGRVGSG